MSERNRSLPASDAVPAAAADPTGDDAARSPVAGSGAPAASVAAGAAGAAQEPGAPGGETPAATPAVPGPEPAAHPTAPVTGRPAVRARRPGPLTRMGPWAPVAGALLGLLLGVVVVLLLATTADTFLERLALVFAVLGLSMLGAAGTLLADEVRMVRQRAREAAVRPQWVEATAGLVNGLTPARLLLLVSAFVLFLSAYVGRS